MNTASGQLMKGSRDFPDRPSEPVDGDHDELIALTKPAHALRPARSVTTRASRGGVGEDPIGCMVPAAAIASCCWSMDCCPVDTRRYAAVLILLRNHRGPTIHPVSDSRELGLACDTGISDSSTWAVPRAVDRLVRVPDV